MGAFSFCIGMRRRRAKAADEAEAGGRSCDLAHRRETPLSFSELMAASAFLDFGGLLDERWFKRRSREENDTGPGAG